jgi:type I restriction enzyme M protein
MLQNQTIEPVFDEFGDIVDFLEGKTLQDTPEERVRQRFLRILYTEYNYPKEVMRTEVPIFHGREYLKDKNNNPIRADIIVYEDKNACITRNQGKIRFVVECKAPTENAGYNQLVSYIFNTSANGGVWYNGNKDDFNIQYYRRLSQPEQKLVLWPNIPRFDELWDSIGRRKRSELLPPHDITGIFKRCHNKLHRMGSEEDDLTMDMVRIILAKTKDEEKEGNLPQFYCTTEEYATEEGKQKVCRLS